MKKIIFCSLALTLIGGVSSLLLPGNIFFHWDLKASVFQSQTAKDLCSEGTIGDIATRPERSDRIDACVGLSSQDKVWQNLWGRFVQGDCLGENCSNKNGIMVASEIDSEIQKNELERALKKIQEINSIDDFEKLNQLIRITCQSQKDKIPCE